MPESSFTLTIQIGNDQMQTREQVARALRRVSRRMVQLPDNVQETRTIMDVNGNSVGQWEWIP